VVVVEGNVAGPDESPDPPHAAITKGIRKTQRRAVSIRSFSSGTPDQTRVKGHQGLGPTSIPIELKFANDHVYENYENCQSSRNCPEPCRDGRLWQWLIERSAIHLVVHGRNIDVVYATGRRHNCTEDLDHLDHRRINND
jgi:hypothetical protein